MPQVAEPPSPIVALGVPFAVQPIIELVPNPAFDPLPADTCEPQILRNTDACPAGEFAGLCLCGVCAAAAVCDWLRRKAAPIVLVGRAHHCLTCHFFFPQATELPLLRSPRFRLVECCC